MSERIRNIVLIAIIATMTLLLVATVSTRPASEDRVGELGSQIKCPVCQGESIADSPSQMARDMMDLVAERVDRGFSDEAIIDELLASYSGAVLLDPPVSGATLALWLAPIVAIAIGATVILWWRRHPGDESTSGTKGGPGRRRLVIGAIVLIGVFSGIVVVAANSLQEREGPSAGVADLDDQDLSEVSNETLEAVIAANLDDPQINGMRLALAGRYYDAGDYRSAFPHYLAVAENGTATGGEAVTSLVRLGWMAYDGNGEVETANRLLDQALEIEPGSQIALYLKATVIWCGQGDAETATTILVSLLSDPDLAEESRIQIEADLARASGNEACA